MNSTNYQYWWVKILTIPTSNTGGIKYEQYQPTIMVGKKKSTNYQYWWDSIWTVLTINSGGIKYKQY